MPDLQSQATLLRSRSKYDFTGWLVTPAQTVVCSRAVNMASISYTCQTITFDNAYSGVGAYTDILEDMTVLVYNGNTSTLKGRLRVAVGAASSTVVQVNELSQAWLDLKDNDRLDFVREWRIWDKLVSATSSFLKDSRLAYSNQNSVYKPVANGGGHVAAFVDDGQVYATVLFDWTQSFTVDPASAGTRTYLADFKDGTVTVGSTSTSTATVRFPVGDREIDLTVTDATNSATATKRIWICVRDRSANLPLQARLEGGACGYTEAEGWSMRFSLPMGSQASLSSLPDGALIIYFEEETYGGVRESFGSNAPAAGRSPIKFVGYLVRDTISIDPDKATVAFEAVGPLGILAQTAALPQLMVRDDTPADWQNLKGLTTALALEYLWYWGASVATVFDFLWNDIPALAYSRLATKNSANIADQIRDIAGAIESLLTCDRLGRLLLIRNPVYESLTDRAARTTAFSLTTADLRDITIPREHRRKLKLVQGSGIQAGTTDTDMVALFSNAPGDAPAEGTDTKQLTGLIVVDQTDLDRIVGEDYASENGLFWDETTHAITPVPKGASAHVPANYDIIDPAYLEWLPLTLAASTNPRGYASAATERWLLHALSIDYDPETGLKDITWSQLDHETHGVPGVAPPPIADTGLPSLPPISSFAPGNGVPINVNPFPPIIGGPTGKIFGIDNTYNLAFASLDGITYFLVGSGTITGTFLHACMDPYNYGRAFMLTTTGLWRCDDVFGAPTVVTHVATETAMTGTAGQYAHQIQMSINRKGYIACSYSTKSVVYSTDYGATWTKKNVTGGAAQTTGAADPVADAVLQIQLSQMNNPNAGNQGWLWAGYVTGFDGSGFGKIDLYLSKNWGSTWTRVAIGIGLSQRGDGIFRLNIPYKRPGGADNQNDSDQILYMYSDDALYSYTQAGGAVGLITDGAHPTGVIFQGDNSQDAFTTYTFDANYMAFTDRFNNPVKILKTDVGAVGADETQIRSSGPNTSAGSPGVNGWPNNHDVLLVWCYRTIEWTSDRGTTWFSLIGNLATLLGANFSPVWVTFSLIDKINPS